MNRPPLYIIIFLFSSASHLFFCSSDDRLTPGQFISINETLVSDGGDFVLGFFSPTNSNASLYVGIWYGNMPEKTVIWVANREKPIKDPSATFQISNNTNLVIVDSTGRTIWTSNLTGFTSPRTSIAAVLLNTGNFVLREGSDNTLWESFDHPTDTFVPGTKLSITFGNNSTQRITSWTNSTDPSPGSFSFGIDTKTSLQLFIWNGSKPYRRSLPWNGDLFAGIDNSSAPAYLSFIATNDELNMTFTVSDTSYIVRCILQPSGHIELLAFNKSSKSWRTTLSVPSFLCDTYGWCGPFGYCDTTATVPTCKCLEGFEPKTPIEWSSGNFSGGCARKKALQCGNGDGFRQLQGMKVPDHFVFVRNNISECKAECINNCSCTAYAYANLTGGSNTIQRCLVWMEELIDTEKIPKGGEDLYLRLVSSELGLSRNKNKIKIIVVAVVLSTAIFLTACGYLAWKLSGSMKGMSKDEPNRVLLNYWGSGTEFAKDFSTSNEVREGDHDNSHELPLINFKVIALSTEHFSDSNKLGQGGFGKVYKGKLPDGQDIAVKRLTRGSGQGLEEFKNEVILIAKLQHRNLVRLLGCCIQGEERLLIYEYMPNKSLDVLLFDPTLKQILDWKRRFDITKGIARALLYLHQDSRLRIIHRDLKASNVLLDKEMNPKVSDFGIARIIGANQHQVNTNRVVGTYGYMSPEYAMEGLYSMKSDIYSFGVLLLEIVTGFRNSSFHHSMDYTNLLAYAWNLWNEGKEKDLIDSSLAELYPLDEVLRSIHVGLLCVQDNPHDRPTISSVVFMLENETKTCPTPKQPMFTIQRNQELDAFDLPMDNLENHSLNNVTITAVAGR